MIPADPNNGRPKPVFTVIGFGDFQLECVSWFGLYLCLLFVKYESMFLAGSLWACYLSIGNQEYWKFRNRCCINTSLYSLLDIFIRYYFSKHEGSIYVQLRMGMVNLWEWISDDFSLLSSIHKYPKEGWKSGIQSSCHCVELDSVSSFPFTSWSWYE